VLFGGAPAVLLSPMDSTTYRPVTRTQQIPAAVRQRIQTKGQRFECCVTSRYAKIREGVWCGWLRLDGVARSGACVCISAQTRGSARV
jgi:hypothetical protein